MFYLTYIFITACLPVPGVCWWDRHSPVSERSGGMPGEEGGREAGGGRHRGGSSITSLENNGVENHVSSRA